jgi:hypothetical protein
VVLRLDKRFLGRKWQKENLLKEQRQSNESLRPFDFTQGHLAGIQSDDQKRCSGLDLPDLL